MGAGVRTFAAMWASRAASLADVYDLYNTQLRRLKLLDFDDILHECLSLLHTRPDVSTGSQGFGGCSQ